MYELIVTIKQRKNSSQIAQRIKIIIELYALFDWHGKLEISSWQ